MLRVYSVYDVAADTYGTPFFVRSEVEASRAFETAVKTPGSPIHDFPDDFRLVYVGDFDVHSGNFGLDRVAHRYPKIYGDVNV